MPRIRTATPDDYPALLALNEAAVPAVNSIPLAELATLHRQAVAMLVACDDTDQPRGFILCLDQGAAYDSLNFRWFAARYPRFAYIDRVVVAADTRSAGIGAALYADLLGRLDHPLLCCEVNLLPPNPGSLRFHGRLGFTPVGEQETEGGSKRVCLMVKNLAA